MAVRLDQSGQQRGRAGVDDLGGKRRAALLEGPDGDDPAAGNRARPRPWAYPDPS